MEIKRVCVLKNPQLCPVGRKRQTSGKEHLRRHKESLCLYPSRGSSRVPEEGKSQH